MCPSNLRCFSLTCTTISVLASVLLISHAAAALAMPGQKCSAAKLKAAGKKANAQVVCYAKAATKGTAVDQACLAKAGAALLKAFQTAEGKGGCATVGDAGAIENMVDDFESAVAAALSAVPPPTPSRTPSPPVLTPTATCSDGISVMGAEACDTRTPTATNTPTGVQTPHAMNLETAPQTIIR